MGQYKTKGCGYFSVPLDDTYGASRDNLGPIEIVTKIKTRGKNDIETLQSIKDKDVTFCKYNFKYNVKVHHFAY